MSIEHAGICTANKGTWRRDGN